MLTKKAKVTVKLIFAAMVFFAYYIVVCAIMGADMGDPWERLMKWAKK